MTRWKICMILEFCKLLYLSMKWCNVLVYVMYLCICHFVKWQRHPFISKRTTCNHFLAMSLYIVYQYIMRLWDIGLRESRRCGNHSMILWDRQGYYYGMPCHGDEWRNVQNKITSISHFMRLHEIMSG